MPLRDSPRTYEDPYEALDVDPIGRVDSTKQGGSYRLIIPIDAIRHDDVPVDESSVDNGGSVAFRVGVSREVPGRIVLDLDREQFPTPSER